MSNGKHSRNGRLTRALAAILIGLGALLLSAGIGYLVYARIAEARSWDNLKKPPAATPLAEDFVRMLQERNLLPSPLPTAEPIPTATSVPMPTAVPPTPQLTPTTATPTPTPTPTPLPTPTLVPTLTPVALDPSQYEKLLPFLPKEPAKPASSLTSFAPPTRLVIPSIGLSSAIIEMGATSDTPAYVVGHYGSTNPGSVGNVALGGENAAFLKDKGDIFGRLEEVQVGDPVVVYTDNNWYLYMVTDLKPVKKTPDVFAQTPDSRLTLFTCWPRFGWTWYLVVTAVSYELR